MAFLRQTWTLCEKTLTIVFLRQLARDIDSCIHRTDHLHVHHKLRKEFLRPS